MKEKLKKFGAWIILIISIFLLFFILFFSLFNMLANFNVITAMVGFYIAVSFSFIATIILTIFIIKQIKTIKSTRFGNWLSLNYPKLILIYIILLLVFISIRPDIIWDYSDLKDVLSLEWAIFGISVAIFIVWNVLIVNYLKEIQPKEENSMSLFTKWEYIIKKGDFYETVSTMFNSVTFLVINLIVLTFATNSTYFLKQEVTLFNQNINIISLYLCVNTIILLLLDVIKPSYKEKIRMLKETKVTDNDIKVKNDAYDQIINLEDSFETIDAFDSINDEQKLKLKIELINKLFGKSQKIQETENKEKN